MKTTAIRLIARMAGNPPCPAQRHSRSTRTVRELVALGLLSAALLLMSRPALSASTGSVSGSVSATPAKYLPETVVYLKQAPGSHSPRTAILDQKAMAFTPHLLVVTRGDTVRFWNHDTVPHNVFSPEGGYNLGTWPPGEYRDHAFEKVGVFSQLCSLHPEMLAYVFVGQNPHATTIGADGRFRLEHVPAGKYQLAVWNSHLKAPDQTIVVAGGKTTGASFALWR